MITYDVWTDYTPIANEGETPDIGSGQVQFMVAGPSARDSRDDGAVKLRWRADIVDPGVLVAYYGYRRPIPERYFATPEGLEEWVHSAAQEFCSEYDYYPLYWGQYTEERKKDDPKDEVIGADPVKGDAGGKLDEPASADVEAEK